MTYDIKTITLYHNNNNYNINNSNHNINCNIEFQTQSTSTFALSFLLHSLSYQFTHSVTHSPWA